MMIVPRTAAEDARVRALRTLMWGLMVDVFTATGAVLLDQAGEIKWERAYWIALSAMLAKTAVQTALAWAGRHIFPPAP